KNKVVAAEFLGSGKRSLQGSARFQNFQSRTVLPVWIERGDGFRKEFQLRNGVEQRHVRPEFHVIRRTEDIGYGLFACRQNEACASASVIIGEENGRARWR